MGKAGRIACIATPFIITAAALASLIVVFLAGSIKNNATLGDLYFIKMNFTHIDVTNAANVVADLSGKNLSNFEGALSAAKQQMGLKDFYTIYLTNYCSWNVGQNPYSNCTAVQRPFAFDPIKAWGLDQAAASLGQNISVILPDNLEKGINLYTRLSHAMFYVYAVSAVALAAALLLGILAIFSRWGSFVTTFFSFVASLATIIASGIATAMFITLKGVLVTVLDKGFSTKTDLGPRIYALTWIATAFALVGFQFWLWSICCCSGRSPYNPGSKDARRTRAEKTPYTYERVGSPMHGGAQHQPPIALSPLKMFGQGGPPGHQQPMYSDHRHNAYEPFRGSNV